jgi:spore maturation protein A
MLNYLWAIMIITGVIYGILSGNITQVADGAIDSSKEAVTLCITMLGVMSLWTGLMQIASKSGLIKKCERLISPVMRWMFPDVSMEHKAMEYMTTNVIANIFGLGWAATPAGIKAMEELAKLNDMRKEADDAMCAFLVINISSLQLIPVNIIAYRSQYGSVNPTAVVLPGLIATIISTVAGIIYCKLKYTKNK